MLYKTKRVIYEYIVSNVRDVRFLGLMVFVVLVLLTSWSGVRIIEINYSLQKEIAALMARNQVRQLENENLKLKNQYLNTDTYLELTARQQFGKGAPDETLILVPREVALSRAPLLPEATAETGPRKQQQPSYLQNFQAWREFYFRKSI